MVRPEVEEIVSAWNEYLGTVDDWQKLVEGIQPKQSNCGLVYEIPNPIDRPNESFAIADMRYIDYAEPHYHKGGEIEIYIVLEGLGRVVVGGQESELKPGSVSVTQPETAHFAVSNKSLVIAVVNNPPFSADNVVDLDATVSNPGVGFDAVQFEVLKQQSTK